MESLLKHYAKGKFGIPVSLPNRVFDPTGFEIWAQFVDMPSSSERGNFKDVRRDGILQINVFAGLNESTEAVLSKVNEIIDHFGTEKAYDYDGETLYVMSSYHSQGLPDGAWFMYPITINYHIV